jgi:hypothetical protein
MGQGRVLVEINIWGGKSDGQRQSRQSTSSQTRDRHAVDHDAVTSMKTVESVYVVVMVEYERGSARMLKSVSTQGGLRETHKG